MKKHNFIKFLSLKGDFHMKKLLSIILVSIMLLSVFTSCQGSEPTKTLPVTKQDTSEKTENKTLSLTKETTEQKTETAEQPGTQGEEMTLDDAKSIIKQLSKDIANNPDKDFGNIDPKVAEAIYLVSSFLVEKSAFNENYIEAIGLGETANTIYDYFFKIQQWIGEQKNSNKDFVFELPEV